MISNGILVCFSVYKQLFCFRSGIEVPFSEKNNLLQEVASMCEESNYNFKEKKRPLPKEQQICNLGKKAREEFAMTLHQQSLENIDQSQKAQPDNCNKAEMLGVKECDYGMYEFIEVR